MGLCTILKCLLCCFKPLSSEVEDIENYDRIDTNNESSSYTESQTINDAAADFSSTSASIDSYDDYTEMNNTQPDLCEIRVKFQNNTFYYQLQAGPDTTVIKNCMTIRS